MAWQRLNGQALPEGADVAPRRRTGPLLGPRQIGDPRIPLGTEAPCPTCGDLRSRQLTPPNPAGVQLWHWSDCRCLGRAMQEQAETVARAKQRAQQYDDLLLGDRGASKIADLQLADFIPQLLMPHGGIHPYTVASAWLATIFDEQTSTRNGPSAPCLYLCSPIKGVGKTHLAAALYWQAREKGKRVAFVEEQSFLHAVWNTPFGPRLDDLLSLPSEDAWLTVLDDLGRRDPGESTGVAKVWNDVISRRYLAHKWTIVTSNYTPDQLLSRGTLDEASYSRLCQMTRQQALVFVGTDQRKRRPQ